MKKRNYSPQFKTKVALEVIKGEKTLSEISSEYGVHPQQAKRWADQFLASAHKVFEKPNNSTEKQLKRNLTKLIRKLVSWRLSLIF